MRYFFNSDFWKIIPTSGAVVRIEWNSVFPWVFSSGNSFCHRRSCLWVWSRTKMCPISDGSAQNLAPWVSLQQEHKHQPWVPSLSCSSRFGAGAKRHGQGRGWEISLGAPQQWPRLQRWVLIRQRLCVGAPAAGKAGSRKWRQRKPNHPVLCHSDSRSSSAHFCGMTP